VQRNAISIEERADADHILPNLRTDEQRRAVRDVDPLGINFEPGQLLEGRIEARELLLGLAGDKVLRRREVREKALEFEAFELLVALEKRAQPVERDAQAPETRVHLEVKPDGPSVASAGGDGGVAAGPWRRSR